jgi:PAS domain-containing protein
MTIHGIDYHITFKVCPGNLALLTPGPDFLVLDVNEAWLQTSGRTRRETVGKSIFDVLPASPLDHGRAGPTALQATLDTVMISGKPDIVPLARYDIEDRGRPGEFEERYWHAVTTPVVGQDGRVSMIALWAQEVTHIVSQMQAQTAQVG